MTQLCVNISHLTADLFPVTHSVCVGTHSLCRRSRQRGAERWEREVYLQRRALRRQRGETDDVAEVDGDAVEGLRLNRLAAL